MNNKFDQYKKNYDEIKKIYEYTDSIKKACEKLNINRNHYYYLLKKYKFEKIFINDTKSKNNKNYQSGGNKSKKFNDFINKNHKKSKNEKYIIDNNKFNNLKVKMISKIQNEELNTNNLTNNITSTSNNNNFNNLKVKMVSREHNEQLNNLINSNNRIINDKLKYKSTNNIAETSVNNITDTEKMQKLSMMQNYINDLYDKKILKK